LLDLKISQVNLDDSLPQGCKIFHLESQPQLIQQEFDLLVTHLAEMKAGLCNILTAENETD
jgi:hypothetical protein